MLCSFIILTHAILTCKVSLMSTQMVLLFLFMSGLGQLLAPVYLSLDICAACIFIFSALSMIAYPIDWIIIDLCFIGLGFFGRGFFACSLLYLN